MKKTLIRHGNSAALIIDKPILELLNIGIDTPLNISTDGSKLIIEPMKDIPGRTKEALKKVNKNHSNTLKKLAK